MVVGDRGEGCDGRRKPLGQALVEFALVLPIAVVLLAAIIQFAFIFERQIGIENAARDAARAAAALPIYDPGPPNNTDNNALNGAGWAYECLIGQPGDPDPPDTCGRHLLSTNVQGYAPGDASVTVCYSNGPADPAGNGQILVTVTVTYHHPLFVPIIAGILDGIDGVSDGKLRVDTSTQFHVETAVDPAVALTSSPRCNL